MYMMAGTGGKQSLDGKKDDHHKKPTRESHIQDVLNGGGDQVSATTSQTGTLEDVDDIVPSQFEASKTSQRDTLQLRGLTS